MTAPHGTVTTGRPGRPGPTPTALRRGVAASVLLFLGLTFTASWLLWWAAAASGGTVLSAPAVVFYALGGSAQPDRARPVGRTPRPP